MLFHNLYYALKGIVREKTSLFWSACFPFILGTLFYVSFGNAVANAEQYHEIPVGFVECSDNEEADYFLNLLKSLEDEEGTKMFDIVILSEKEAKKQLEDEKLDGYYLVAEDISLVIAENGTNQTILNIFLVKYQQQSAMVMEILETNPEMLNNLMKAMEDDISYYKEVNQTEGNMDPMSQYFYALIAMSCLFGSNMSFERAKRLQGNISALGARRCVAPASKTTVILSEFFACLLIQCVIESALVGYLKGICGIELGEKTAYMLLSIFVGSAFGIALGFCFGSIAKLSEGMRNGLLLAVTLGCSFFSGLMINSIKQWLEDNIPLVNRINPATLITDSLYALNVYDTMNRYWMNMVSLIVMTAVLCAVSILMVRRTQYASV